MAHRELTTSEKSALESIAYELGIYGGEAVYMARAMLRIFVDEDLTFARTKAPEFYTNKKDVSKAILSFVYPNPANNEFHLVIPGSDQEEKFVTIADAYGKIVNLSKWEKNTPIFTINSGSFSPGIYNVSVSIKNGVSQTNKLVIIH